MKEQALKKEDITFTVLPDMEGAAPEPPTPETEAAYFEPPTLLPDSVEIVRMDATDLQPILKGQVLLQPVNPDGTEAGRPFITTEKALVKYYSDESKYIVKKKAL